MSDEISVFSCKHCGTKFNGAAAAQKARCVKCQKIVDRKMDSVAASIPETPNRSPQAIRPAMPNASSSSSALHASEQLGFLDYCWRSYADTHSPLLWFFSLTLGLMLIPIISFSKPLIGIKGIWYAFGMTTLLGLSLFVIIYTIAGMKYLSKKQRYIPEGHSNWLSALTCFLLTLTPALGMIAAAESLGPENGILVTILPQLNRDQARLVTKATNKPPETELDASNSGDHDAAAPLPRDSSDSTVTDAPSISTSEPLQEIDSAAIPEPSDTSDDEASPKTPKAVANLKTTESTTESTQEDSETQQTPQPRDTVPSADEEIPKSTDSNSKAKSQGVIAEGVGATADEAIKDAFRNAVRQVVGAVVDAETLVNNDEVIDDKVLTYSDGFIKGYEEVPGSRKVKGGLHRIKIKAQVERRSVIAKLKAANVTVKEIDGKGLFAEAVTQLDAEKDAAALLKKQFEGFPQSCITATIIGKPEIVEKSTDKATVKFTILIEPDLNAYKSFSGKLILILDKLAKDKGEFTAVFESQMTQDNSFTYFFPKQPGRHCEIMADWMPKSFSGVRRTPQLKSDFTTLALTTQRSKASDRLECRYYRIDKSLQPLLADIGFRKGSGKLSLLGTNNEVVITDRFSLSERAPWNTDTYEGTLIASAGNIYGEHFYMLGRENDRDERKKQAFLFWIGPVFLLPNTSSIHHKPSIKVTRILPLSLDELKSVKDVKVEIIFDE